MARAIKHIRDLTVITNAVNIAAELAGTDVEVILTGGVLRRNSFSLVGPLAEDSLRHVTADILFLAVDGFDIEYGLTTPNLLEARANRVMMENAKTTVIVCDSSKFGRRSLSFIAPTSSVHHTITDKKISPGTSAWAAGCAHKSDLSLKFILSAVEEELSGELNSTIGAHTIAEIRSEPATWKACLQRLEGTGELRSLSGMLLQKVEWVFIGCGSSFYLAQAAAASWSILTGERSRAIPASEIMLFPQSLPVPCQPVLISRSGHTSEAVDAAEYLERTKNLRTLAITCGVGTPIQKVSSHCIVLPDADEKSTVMTRSFTSMLLVLQCLAAVRGNRGDFLEAAGKLSEQVSTRFDGIHEVVKALAQRGHVCRLCIPGPGPIFWNRAGIDVEGEGNVVLVRAEFSHAGISARPESDRKPRNADHLYSE